MAKGPLFFILFLALVLIPIERADANPFFGSQDVPTSPVVGRASSPFSGAQLYFRSRLAAEFSRLDDGAAVPALVAMLAASFLFGLLHSAGPGHRKTIIFWLFLGRKAMPYEPLAVGFLSAAIHTLTGALLVGVLGLARGAVASLSDLDTAGIWIDGLSFLAVAAVSLWLIFRSAIEFFRGGGHSHGPKGRGLYAYVLVASLTPCPASIMILLFTMYLDLTLVGLLSLAAAAIGIGVTITVVGYAAWFGRERLFSLFDRHGKPLGRLSAAVEFAASLAILGGSLFISWPFIASLVRV